MLPPALFMQLSCCWQPEATRATAKEMYEKFRALVRLVEERHDVDTIRNAWKRAEDTLAKKSIISEQQLAVESEGIVALC